MDAKRCDRCRKYYDEYHESRRKPFSNGMAFVDRSTTGYSRKYIYDLCPDCMRELWNFMKNEKAE